MKFFRYIAILSIFITASFASWGWTQTIKVIGYNVESGDADPNIVAKRLADVNGCDIWGLSEVLNEDWARIFETAAEQGENADYQYILGTTGRSDKLLIIYDAGRFKLIRTFEISDINIGGHVRAPLLAEFQVIPEGQTFYFMVNHLYRSRADRRHIQAQLLNEWAARQRLPVIAVGDYNFDWNVQNGETHHDRGYDLMVVNDIFRWIRPARLIKTQASTRYNSVLDFVFTSREAKKWALRSTILVVPGDFPDTPQTSDHRAVQAIFDLSRQPVALVSKPENNLPDLYLLGNNYPNPFNPVTIIQVNVLQAGDMELTIYNGIGERIKVLHSGTITAGEHSFTWYGRNEYGNTVPGGVYFYHLSTSSGFKSTGRMTLLK